MFFLEKSEKTWTGSQFADVNSPEAQRYFNYLCMAYGGDPVNFAYLAEKPEDKNKEPTIRRIVRSVPGRIHASSERLQPEDHALCRSRPAGEGARDEMVTSSKGR